MCCVLPRIRDDSPSFDTTSLLAKQKSELGVVYEEYKTQTVIYNARFI